MQREWEQRARTDALGFIGRGYAVNDTSFWSSGDTDVAQQILDGLRLERDATVLEIGCGVGRLLRPLAGRVGAINGVDIAPGMIARGRELLADLPDVRLQVTAGTLDMFSDRSLDFVFSFVVFQHIPAKSAIIRYISETARVLKPGGIFKFQIDGRSRSFWKGTDTWLGVWFKSKEIQRILSRHGFELVDSWGEETQYFWITARLKTEAGSPPAKAHASPPTWNATGLAGLLDRIGLNEETSLTAIVSGQRSLRDVTRPLVQLLRNLPDDLFVQTAFRVILGREADAAGLAFYNQQLAQAVSRTYIIDCLLSSAELRAQVRQPALTKS